MRTTIDSAGRLVVPKPLREAMGLAAGKVVDIVFINGRIEIELAPAQVHVEVEGGFPRVVSDEDLPPLSDEQIRETLEATRR